MTQEEYLRSRMRWFDHVCWYMWIVPVASVFVMVLLGLGESEVSQTPFAYTFVIGFGLTVAGRTILGGRIEKWKEEYEKMQNRNS